MFFLLSNGSISHKNYKYTLSDPSNSIFYFQFQANIWKILPDERNNGLILELRDPEERTADFVSIGLSPCEKRWQGLQTEESWWLGLESVKDGRLFLHGYKNAENPEHSGIFAYDTLNGKKIWENNTLSFRAHAENGILAASSVEGEDYTLIDPPTGKITGSLDEKSMYEALSGIMRSKQTSGIQNALHFTGENQYFKKIADFVQDATGHQPVAAFDYMEFEKFLIISYYIYHNGKLKNYLRVIKEDGSPVLQEKLDENLNGVGMDTFFMFNGRLIFIKNKKELVIAQL